MTVRKFAINTDSDKPKYRKSLVKKVAPIISKLFQMSQEEILKTLLILENISGFRGPMQNLLIGLTYEVISRYQTNRLVETAIFSEKLENRAFNRYGIENFSNVLNHLQSKLEAS